MEEDLRGGRKENFEGDRIERRTDEKGVDVKGEEREKNRRIYENGGRDGGERMRRGKEKIGNCRIEIRTREEGSRRTGGEKMRRVSEEGASNKSEG